MIFRYLDFSTYVINQSNISLLIKFPAIKDIWIFNCTEGCQFNIVNQNFKINNLSKIIITDLHIKNISGLLGLLSSLNLIGRVKSLHIYGPHDLKYYLDLGKKYSRTNFNYVVYIHILKTGLVINQQGYRIYSLYKNNYYEFIMIHSEHSGTFFLEYAKKNYLVPGPLYGKLKKGSIFLLPDGFVLNGNNLTSSNLLGDQFCLLTTGFYNRTLLENAIHSRIVFLL
uniref:Ribonuclease Z n=1 Tax=Alsidium seaforthii TaxID=2007182 RepID=A0A1Z1MDA4_9FLOR|nr:ribonuclease Z [Bryothamnion seaforthii]ARW63852.1 ribonuclease Z [Bryothamnion seaforthii]